MNVEQREKVQSGAGFVAALDQSGGSTPKALRVYGIEEDAYSGDEEMFDLVHQMRTRIITSPSFDGDRILAAILFENTMDREIEGRPTADYLWNVKRVVPFLKVDKGLAAEDRGAQVMKPIPNLDELLARAVDSGIFGTKMRSVIKLPGAGARRGRRAAVRDRPADPRHRSGPDHRAGGRHSQPAQGRSGRPTERRTARRRRTGSTTRWSC